MWKRILLMGGDMAGGVVAAWGAFMLHGRMAPDLLDPWWQLPFVIAAVPIAATRFGLYTAVIRYIAVRAAFNVARAVVPVSGLLLILGLQSSAPLTHPVVAINFGILLLLALGVLRLTARYYLNTGSDRDAERLIIFGAGSAGAQVAQALAGDRRRRVLGFVDDKRELVGSVVSDLPVYPVSHLPDLVESQRVTSILLAVPSASRHRKQKLLDWIETLPVMVKTVPGLHEILSGQARINDIREIGIEDLLGRDPVPPDDVLLSCSIAGRVVMVTGAGGSIGSELCRQIVTLRPEHLVLFEANEHALFVIDRELRQSVAEDGRAPHISAVMGDVRDRDVVAACIRRFGVQTLYHAAAYKHVPLVEQNVGASLRNNVLGTWNVAEAAVAQGVERFILISTDKAVRPTSVMGATKRVAELVIQAISQRSRESRENGCIFSMVRFGNVLGSSGSVVPYFREQIRIGGPITVTHADITRYFMTIPEASQLVIQAGAMARGGEVFLLDMGAPVRIVDLAQQMIHLAGYTRRDEINPDGDIEIVFTGLRPGEKLYEELLIAEATVATAHAKIACAKESCLTWSQLEPLLHEMKLAATSHETGVVKQLLQRAVPEYDAATDDHDVICETMSPEREQIRISQTPSVASSH